MHKIIKFLTSRMVTIGILIIVQVAYLFYFITSIANSSRFTPYLTTVGIFMAIYIYNTNEDPDYRILWCMLVLVSPIIGVPLYLLFAGKKVPKKLSQETRMASNAMLNLLHQDEDVMLKLRSSHPHIAKIFSYALDNTKYPVYQNTNAEYFGSGEEAFPRMLEEMEKAEHFIFLEYFIIKPGEMWDRMLDVLKRKAASGVEIKMVYDDFGCAASLPVNYDRELAQYGIEAYRFNKLRPRLMITMNNRDHRKLLIVDNRVGFTGGINLADEYINSIKRFGYWRDSVIMLEGEAVWSMTDMFLGMFSYLKPDDDDIDYSKYHLEHKVLGNHGFFQPFSDTPTDEFDLGLSTHLNMINHARHYVYIDTPYLVPNGDIMRALCLAAQSGLDVRILVPHIPDKQYVFSITRSNYSQLIRCGVRIYEYTPGFNHTKNLLIDDRMGLVGTINTDYRSYFLHFEDGVLMYHSPELMKMKRSFLEALEVSHEVQMEEVKSVNVIVRMYRGMLRLFAPLF